MTLSIQQQAVIDGAGNIVVHGRSGVSVEISFINPDGTYQNVVAEALYLEIEGVLRVALGAGSQNYSRTITLTQAQVASIGSYRRRYAIVDTTTTPPSVLLAASISVYGFTAQPS